MLRFCLLLIGCAALGGCFGGVDCPTVPHEPVTAEVVDSVTGQPAATGATGELRNATDVIPMHTISDRHMQADRTATGVFALIIRKAGYREYTAPVRVRSFECGPEDVEVRVRLAPL
jgi:hypothetical protein